MFKDKKETINKLVEMYKESIETGKTESEIGVNYDAKNNTLYFKYAEKDYEVSKYDLADDPDIGDKLAKQIIQWAQPKFN